MDKVNALDEKKYTLTQLAKELSVNNQSLRYYLKKMDMPIAKIGDITYTDRDCAKLQDFIANDKQIERRGNNKSITPEKLAALVRDYIDSNIIETPRVKTKIIKHKNADDEIIEEPVLSKSGKQVIDVELAKPLTITGLCIHCGIIKEQLQDYANDKDYDFIVKQAREEIENYLQYVSMNEQYNVTGALFNLKCNFGYNDKQGQQTNVQINNIERLIKVCEDKSEF